MERTTLSNQLIMSNQNQLALPRAERIKREICKLLQWTEMQFCEDQHQNGIAYLYWYLPCDELARYQMERSKLYWAWFKNQWTIHDESLLYFKNACRKMSVSEARNLYNEVHCPRILAKEVKPNSVVLSSIKIKYTV